MYFNLQTGILVLCGLVTIIESADTGNAYTGTDTLDFGYVIKELNSLKSVVHGNTQLIEQLTNERREDKMRIAELTQQLQSTQQQLDRFQTKTGHDLKDILNQVNAGTKVNVSEFKVNENDDESHDNHARITDDHLTSPEIQMAINRRQTSRHLGSLSKRQIVTPTQAPVEKHVAFSAYITAPTQGVGTSQTLPFDSVTSNIGDAFDVITHMFTCPVGGVYVFQCTILTTQRTFLETEIVKEGVALARMYAAGAYDADPGHGHDQGTNAVVTTCNQGEHVWVRVTGAKGTFINSSKFTTFSGFLLFSV